MSESITWNGHELSEMEPLHGGRQWFSCTGRDWRASVVRNQGYWYAWIEVGSDDLNGASATDPNSPTVALDTALAEVEQQSVTVHRAVSAMQGQR